ncbi:hypothetical protein ACJMK2_042682 [Sinanodonta woodiana]|uniref:HTH CENPB-type domain-containing protein n=1 Tax=Sinanodonta woodiana TaxID=1069815 RepID=A0ABD3W853_SINWO
MKTATGRQFSCCEKNVHDWKLEEKDLIKMSPRKQVHRGRTARWPNLEENLSIWVSSPCDRTAFSTISIKLEACIIVAEMKIIDFHSSANWLVKFM